MARGVPLSMKYSKRRDMSRTRFRPIRPWSGKLATKLGSKSGRRTVDRGATKYGPVSLGDAETANAILVPSGRKMMLGEIRWPTRPGGEKAPRNEKRGRRTSWGGREGVRIPSPVTTAPPYGDDTWGTRGSMPEKPRDGRLDASIATGGGADRDDALAEGCMELIRQ